MMNMTDDGRMSVMSHPSWVRELKWRLHDLWQVRYTAALPHGVRELKSPNRIERIRATESHPTGGV